MGLFNHRKSTIPLRRQQLTVQSVDTFRRNRTLVGTTSNNLNSTNVIRSGLQSPRTHVHHLATRRRKVLSTLLIILASCAILWMLVSNFTASPIIVISGRPLLKSIDKSRYSKVIQDYLQANPMGRFSFLLNQANLTAYTSGKLPEVEEVTLQGMEQIGRTNFVVKMRTPVAGWVIDGKQYYVDSKGVTFELNYFADPTVQIVDNSGVPVQAGTTSVSKRFLGFVGRVVSLAGSNGYIVTKAILPAGTMRELDISIKDSAINIKLSIDRPVGEQIEDMSRALNYLKTHALSPSYIDVRVSNKAFFK